MESPQYLYIPLDNSLFAVIPIGISQDDYELILSSLALWQKRLVKQDEQLPTIERVQAIYKENL